MLFIGAENDRIDAPKLDKIGRKILQNDAESFHMNLSKIILAIWNPWILTTLAKALADVHIHNILDLRILAKKQFKLNANSRRTDMNILQSHFVQIPRKLNVESSYINEQ